MGSRRHKPFSFKKHREEGPVVGAMGFGKLSPGQVARKAGKVFRGEEMTCILCGARQTSSPDTNTQWRICQLDGDKFYACPNEFPPDGSSEEAFEAAYRRFLLKAMEKRQLRKLN